MRRDGGTGAVNLLEEVEDVVFREGELAAWPKSMSEIRISDAKR